MDKPFKFALPSPNFNKNVKDACKPKPHFLTPSGMSLLPREKQPPPMYGKHGATVPPRFLQQQRLINEKTTVIEAAPLPAPPEKQYCEPCELELNSLEDFKRHRAQHEKCPVAGCLYKGHPSVMDKHVNALHASGLFDKFKKLSTPEEIAAWRNERRKRYPTLANVLLKQKAQEQRQKRGERLDANKNRFGKPNDRKRAQPNNPDNTKPVEEKKPREEGKTNQKNNKRNRNKNKRDQRNKNIQEIKPKLQNEFKANSEKEEETTDLMCGGIKMFAGTSQMKDYKHFNDKKKLETNNALIGLVGMYGSDDDDEEDDEELVENECVRDQNSKSVETISEVDVNMHTENEVPVNSLITEVNDVICEKLEKLETTKENNFSEATKANNISQITPDAPSSSQNQMKIIEDLNENTNPNDNSSDEAPEETAIQRSIPDYPAKVLSIPKNTSTEETVDKRSNQTEKATKPKQVVKRKLGLDYRKARWRKQNTMLEKLLEADIRHERNVLLQCVRYVCENNFFGIGQNNQEKLD